MLICTLCICTAFAAEPSEITLDSGIYTIKNKLNNQNLNAFDFSYSKEGFAYTAEASGDEGENILIVKQSDGSYLLYPQSEMGEYAFFVSDGKLAKAKELSPAAYFTLELDGGAYIIKDKDGLALTLGGETLYKKPLVNACEYDGGDAQKWELTKVSVTSFELKTVARDKRVKLNSVSAVYAVVTPSYMKNFIKWYSSDESVLLIDDDGSFCAVGVRKATVTAKLKLSNSK